MPTIEDEDTELASKERLLSGYPVSNCRAPFQCAMADRRPLYSDLSLCSLGLVPASSTLQHKHGCRLGRQFPLLDGAIASHLQQPTLVDFDVAARLQGRLKIV